MTAKNRKTKQKQNGISRRKFLGSTAIGAAAFTIVPRHVLGGRGYTAASEKLHVAGVGIGGMGKNNVKNCSNENIVALCDVDHDHAAKIFDLYPKAKRYKDYRRMLEKQKDIDAVVIATPDHTHAVIAMAAMRAGKHVYVQKPLAHSVYEARMLTEAARKYKVATQMGNQGHSTEGIRLICEWIADDAIGQVRKVYAWTDRPGGRWAQGVHRPVETPKVPKNLDWDLWLGPAPYRPFNEAYHPFKWRGWWDFGTGSLGDMACHIMDPVFWALKLGSPDQIIASYAKTSKIDSIVETAPVGSIVHYRFPARGNLPEVKMEWYDGGLMPPRPVDLEPTRRMGDSNGGVIFEGDKGKIMCGCYAKSPRLIPETSMQAYNQPEQSIERVEGSHEQDWIDACKGGDPASSNFDISGPLAESVVLGNLAIRNPNRVLDWDGDNMRVTNYEKANELVRHKYRKGWTL